MDKRVFLLELLQNYVGIDDVEELCRMQMIEFVKENERCFDNKLEPGHVTGSALIVDRSKKNTLLTHHA